MSYTQTEFKAKLESLRNASISQSEFNYYIKLLVSFIHNHNDNPAYHQLLGDIDTLISSFNRMCAPKATQNDLLNFNNAVNALIETSQAYTFTNQVQRALMTLIGWAFGLTLGLAFSLPGAMCGVYLNPPSFKHLIGGLFDGAVIGYHYGSILGFRMNRKLFVSDEKTELYKIVSSISRIQEEKSFYFNRERQKTYINVRDIILKNLYPHAKTVHEKSTCFNSFLASNQSYEVCSFHAGHLSAAFKGYLGHHLLIRFSLNANDKTYQSRIDKNQDDTYRRYVDAKEETPRQVNGAKIVEMMVLDMILKKGTGTHAEHYEIGVNDCKTYVDKILIGTGQAPTHLSTFDYVHDKWIARKVIGPLMQFFSPIHENALERPSIKTEDTQDVGPALLTPPITQI